MKNLILIYLFMLSGIAAKSQNIDYQTKTEREESEKETNIDRQKIKDNHISSMKVYSYKFDSLQTSKHGRLTMEQLFDQEGNMTDYKLYKKNGKVKYHYSYQYDLNGKIIESTNWKSNRKMRAQTTMSYDSSGNLTDEREFWKKRENMVWHSVSSYDAKQNLIELKYILNNDKKVFEHYVYSYYPDGSKKETIEYNRKNKVWHTWNFDCNPVGKLEGSTLKDTNKICVRLETDKDGNKIKIKEENTRDGKYKRMISKYDQNNNLVDFTGYNSKERIKYHSHSAFDAQNNISEYIVYRPNTTEIKQRYIYHYDTSGNLVELLSYKKTTVPDLVKKFSYQRQQ